MSTYYERHREERKEYARQRMGKNEYMRGYYQEHKETIRSVQQDKRAKLKAEVFSALGNKCAHCGFNDPRALQIDHVYGNGNGEAKLRKHSDAYHKHILEQISQGSPKYQLLCANCNWIKRHEQGEHN